jgi:hypothetical protein
MRMDQRTRAKRRVERVLCQVGILRRFARVLWSIRIDHGLCESPKSGRNVSPSPRSRARLVRVSVPDMRGPSVIKQLPRDSRSAHRVERVLCQVGILRRFARVLWSIRIDHGPVVT